MNGQTFFADWIKRASRGALLSVGFKGRQEAVRSALIWGISMLALYFTNWQNVPLLSITKNDISSEVRFGISGIIAFIFLFVLSFMWSLIKEPAAMYKELQDRAASLSEKQGKEIIRLKKHIEEICDAEATLKILSALHSEGYALYKTQAEKEVWEMRMEEWSHRVERFLEENFSVAALHRYKKPGSGFEITTTWKWDEEGGRWLKAKYYAKIYSIDELVQSGDALYLARFALPDVQTEQSAEGT